MNFIMHPKLIISFFIINALVGISEAKPKPIDGRIIGGDDANIEDYSYQLAFMLKGEEQCGAALIHPKWALTAGHCTHGIQNLSSIAIKYNSSYLSEGETAEISRIIKHPEYDYNGKGNDISILELAKPLVCKNCKPIPLSRTTPKTGDSVTVTGWGVTKQDFYVRSPDHLKVITVPVLSHKDCKDIYENYKYPAFVTDGMFCIGYQSGGKGSCYGDSGGPAVINGHLSGLDSFAVGCARPGFPEVYTNVASYFDWIEKETGILF